ncbi:MAG: Asp-tRNA(Asn)/Glu-tRNA(Gln) amidotransferase subunit GatC [Thermoanaerobaculia bacterium]
MKIDSELVARVAKLASLEPTPAEAEALAGQLTRIVEHFEALRSIPDGLLVDTADPEPSPLRADLAGPTLPEAIVSANAPEFSHGHFLVPRIVNRAE